MRLIRPIGPWMHSNMNTSETVVFNITAGNAGMGAVPGRPITLVGVTAHLPEAITAGSLTFNLLVDGSSKGAPYALVMTAGTTGRLLFPTPLTVTAGQDVEMTLTSSGLTPGNNDPTAWLWVAI